jgi:hypothetical protein
VDASAERRVVDWLLQGDAAVRWQALRDLEGAPEAVWRRERRRVATTGWGRALLDRQRPDGNWGRGPYQPKWTCTTYTMELLRQLGLPPRHPAALRACAIDLAALAPDGSPNFWGPRRVTGDACVTGMILAQLAAFEVRDRRVERLVEYALREQLPDGGWNCQRRRGAVHSSFHTTTCVLEGLHAYTGTGRVLARAADEAAARGREFLAVHRLYRSHRTGRVVAPELTRFHFPPQWHHDVLRALDHFRAAGAPRDPRLADAIAVVERRRGRDGRWTLPRPFPGAVHLVLEETGAASRMNTLRALRVLRWWKGP